MIYLGLKYQESTPSTSDQQRERLKRQIHHVIVARSTKRNDKPFTITAGIQHSRVNLDVPSVSETVAPSRTVWHCTNVPSQQHTRRHEHWQRGAYNQNRFLNRQGDRDNSHYSRNNRRPMTHDRSNFHRRQNHSHHVSCYHCGESSHDTEQCRFTSRVRCFRCHSLGHKERQCSR